MGDLGGDGKGVVSLPQWKVWLDETSGWATEKLLILCLRLRLKDRLTCPRCEKFQNNIYFLACRMDAYTWFRGFILFPPHIVKKNIDHVLY